MKFQISFGFVFIHLLSPCFSSKICNNRGELVEGNRCLCKEDYTGEKCEFEVQQHNSLKESQKQFFSLLSSKFTIQRMKREVVNRVDHEEGSRSSNRSEPTEGSATAQPEGGSGESPYFTCPAEQIYLPERESCEKALLFGFTITNRSGFKNNTIVIEQLGSTLEDFDLLGIIVNQLSSDELEGFLFFDVSSKMNLSLLYEVFLEIAQDQLSFFVDDVNECDDSFSCDSNQDCQNNVGSYSCSCKHGFVLEEVSTNEVKCKSVCTQNFCFNGGKCVADEDNIPVCSCSSGYGGMYCEETVESIRPWWEATIALATVAGFLIICLFLIVIVHVCKKRKEKSHDTENNLVAGSNLSEDKASAPPYGGSNENVSVSTN